MGLVGNDIIDWALAKTQHQKLRPRCLEKLFHLNAIEIIHNSDNPLQSFWVLWSIKESAYKAWQRAMHTTPIFNPKAFQIITFQQNETCITSRVRLNDFLVNINTEITNNYIYSYCNSTTISNEIYTNRRKEYIYLNLLKENWFLKKQNFNIPE
jgi:phosphopantetheinyl transferase (holo-ACP synthase)